MKITLDYYCIVEEDNSKIATSCGSYFKSLYPVHKLVRDADTFINLYESLSAANKAKHYYEKDGTVCKVKKVKVVYDIED